LEEVLRYKKLDGVPEALAALAEEWFPGGRHRVALNDAVATLKLPVQIIGGREDRINPGRPCRRARFTPSGSHRTNRTPAAHGNRRGVNRLIKRLIENQA